MMLRILPLLPMVLLLSWAAIIDFRTRRIPNWLTFSVALGGLAASFVSGSAIAPLASFLGLMLGLGIMLPQYALGALRGGDVKVMAAIGAWVGPTPIFAIFIIQAVVGMVIVLVQCAWQGRLRTLFTNSAVLVIHAAHSGDLGLRNLEETGKSCRSVEKPLPYAVPVMVASLILLLWL
jgi:prepilin peptidase CpaA